jgi:ribosomal protein S4
MFGVPSSNHLIAACAFAFSESKNWARNMVNASGVHVNDSVVTDVNHRLEKRDVVRVGKKKHNRIFRVG